jgi:hypothetical protein
MEAARTGTRNIAIGDFAMAGAQVTGDNNIGIGSVEGSIGYGVLNSLTSASNNVALGGGALPLLTTGGNNCAMGYRTGSALTTGVQNTLLGTGAGIAITTGNNNIAVGGVGCFTGATTDVNSTIVGCYAGGNLVGGYQNTYYGYNLSASSATVAYEIIIGSGVTGKGTSTGFISAGSGVYQGNNSSSWSTTSDRRLKKSIVDNNVGLDAINSIRVRNFEYRVEEEITELPTHCAIKKEGVQLGVIAQELQAVLPDCVKQESTGVLSVDPDNLTWYLVNAVKQLSAQVESLKSEINQLKGA